jgi:hypothetical protein
MAKKPTKPTGPRIVRGKATRSRKAAPTRPNRPASRIRGPDFRTPTGGTRPASSYPTSPNSARTAASAARCDNRQNPPYRGTNAAVRLSPPCGAEGGLMYLGMWPPRRVDARQSGAPDRSMIDAHEEPQPNSLSRMGRYEHWQRYSQARDWFPRAAVHARRLSIVSMSGTRWTPPNCRPKRRSLVSVCSGPEAAPARIASRRRGLACP